MDSKKIEQSWEHFITQLQTHLEEDEFEAWVTKLVLEKFEKNRIEISGLNRFFCNWVSEHHSQAVKKFLLESFKDLRKDFQLILKVGEVQTASVQKASHTSTVENNCLDPNFTFERFINGKNTNIAYAAARAVADNFPQTKYNPLFICGDVGLGKTHLMQSIGNQIQKEHPGTKILYTSTEQFTNEVINGIRFECMNDVREKFRSLDLLLIDDIQFLENKNSTQEEFFHTFNELILNQKQVILTSDRYPREIKKINERLTSRFSSGMVGRIDPPEFETRLAIIQSEIDRMNFPINSEVSNYIASVIKTNIRDIKGILIRLEAEWSLLGLDINVDTTKRVLKEVLSIESTNTTVDDVIKEVCKKFNVKMSDIKSDKRDREISSARQIAMYIAREVIDLSYPVIGKHFGGKNHTSVLQACRKTKKNMSQDPEIRQTIVTLIRELTT